MIGLFLLWFAGFLYLLWKRRRVYRGLRQLCADESFSAGRTGEAEAVEEKIASIQKDLKIKGRLRVRHLPGTHTPCVFGVFRPVIFLPEQPVFSEPVNTAILKHELFISKTETWRYNGCLLL